MATDVGELTARLKFDTKQFDDSTKRVRDKFEATTKSMASGFERVSATATKLSGVIGAIFGVGAIGGAIALGKATTDLAGRLSDLSQQYGLNARTLSGLKTTIENSGSSLEEFGRSWSVVLRNLTIGGQQTERARGALEQLGFTSAEMNLALSDTDRFLSLLADRLAKIQNPSERLRIAMELGGQQAAKFAAALGEMAGKFDKLKTSGMSDSDIRQLAAFGDHMNSIANSMQILASVPLGNIARLFAIIREGGGMGHGERSVEEIEKDLEAARREAQTLTGKIFSRDLDIPRLEQELAQARERLDDKDLLSGFPPAQSGDKEAAKRNAAFAASLKESSNALQQQLIGLMMGPDAAEAYALEVLEAKAAMDGLTAAEKEQLARHQRLVQNLREKTDAYRNLAQSVEESRDDVRFSLEEESGFLGRTRAELEQATSAWEEYRRTVLAAVEATKDDPRFSLDEEEITFGVGGEGLEAARQANAAAAAPGQFAQGLSGDVIDPFRSAIQQLITGSRQFENIFASSVQGIFLNVSGRILEENMFKPLEKALTDLIQTMIQNVSDSISGGSSGGGGIGGIISGFFGSLAGGLFGGPSLGFDAASGLWEYHQGGLVTMHGGGFRPDERMARLQAGEFVLSRAATAAIGASSLSYMNESGRMPVSGYMPEPKFNVEIRGGIVPEKRGMSKDELVRIVLEDYEHNGPMRTGVKNIVGR